MVATPDLPERIDRYEILEILGRGSMGEVYLALDPKFDRRIALKVMSGHRLGDDDELDELRQRFVVEGRAAGRLNHPGIVTLYDADTDAVTGWPFLAMEWIDGESLRRRLKRDGRLDVRRTIDLGAQVARALAYAHSQGVVHRDIKPANLLVHRDGRVKVADFGVAKLVSSSLTLTGQVLGSPNYMAPEQVRAEPVDGRTDLFAVGVVLYEALTGRPAFAAESLAGITFKIVSVDPRPIGIYNNSVPEALDAVLRKALEKRPEDRFASGTEMAEALDAVARGLPDDEPRHATRELTLAAGRAVAAGEALAARGDATSDAMPVRPPAPPIPTVATWRGRVLRPLAVMLGVLALALAGATLALRPNAHELQDLTRRLGLFELPETSRPTRASAAEPESFDSRPPTAETADILSSVDGGAAESTADADDPPAVLADSATTVLDEGRVDDQGADDAVPVDGAAAGEDIAEDVAVGEGPADDPVPSIEPAEAVEEPAVAPPPPPPPPARVVLEFENRYRRAYLAAWVDGRQVLMRRLEASGVMPRIVGQVHQFEIRVPPGRHKLEVHVSGLSTRVEARGAIHTELRAAEKRLLAVELVRGRDAGDGSRADRLELSWK